MDIQFFNKFPHYPTFLVIRLPFCPVWVRYFTDVLFHRRTLLTLTNKYYSLFCTKIIFIQKPSALTSSTVIKIRRVTVEIKQGGGITLCQNTSSANAALKQYLRHTCTEFVILCAEDCQV